MSPTRAVTAQPCARCPFRTDVPIYLRADRRREIVESLLNDGSFACHGEVRWDEDDDGEPVLASTGAECAGAVKAYLADGGVGQLVRVSERLGMVDLDRLDATGADVWPLSEWPRVPEGETAATWDPDEADEIETCVVCDPGCLAPAGYRGAGGGIVAGSVSADGECAECGEPLCSNCANDDGLCSTCAPYDEEDR